jgi:DNA-binding winged helix-turn-helix (wHTH) protein/Tfp pilus assembly protein PilF
MCASPHAARDASQLTIVRFGIFEFDPESGDLMKQGRKIRLGDQPFHVLRMLIQREGRLVTREELQRELWDGNTFVDFDVGLNSAIRKLRDALGDAADNPRFIETIPRRGYRFIAPLSARGAVNRSDAGGLTSATDVLEVQAADSARRFDSSANARRNLLRFAGLALALTAITSIGLVAWNLRRTAVKRSINVQRSIAGRAVIPEAYEAYVNGLRAEGQETYEGFRAAVDYFQQAIAKQPDFALAYAGLGQAQHQFLFVGPLSPRETNPKAEAAVRRALELDPDLGLAHRVLAGILHDFYWDWNASDREFQRYRDLTKTDPGKPIAALIRRGRVDEAVEEAQRRRTLDPRAIDAVLNLAWAYRAAGDYERAAAELRRMLETGTRAPRVHFALGATLALGRHLDDAINELETAIRLSSHDNPQYRAYLGYAYAAADRPTEARRILSDLEALSRRQYVSGFGLALIYDALGEQESAVAQLERAYNDRALEFAYWSQIYPHFRTISSDLRFQALMLRLGSLP